MPPEPSQVVDAAAMVDADDVLLDDRTRVELRGYVMRGRANQLDTTFGGG